MTSTTNKLSADNSAMTSGDAAAGPDTATMKWPDGRELKILRTRDELESVAAGWRQLEKENADTATAFQSFDWTRNWTFYFAASDSRQLHIVAGFRHGQLCYVLPLQVCRQFGQRVLTWATYPIGQYGDALCAADESVHSWSANALAFLRSSQAADVISLPLVRETALIAPFLQQQFYLATQPELAPALDLTAIGPVADYFKRYTREQRRRRTRIRRKIEQIGPISYQRLKPGTGQAAEIAPMLAEKLKWLNGRGRRSGVLADSQQRAFLEGLANLQGASLAMSITRLDVGGKPMAWSMGLRFNAKHYYYISAHLHGLTALSAARMLLDATIMAAMEDGVTEFDLMTPFHPHKSSYASKTIKVNHWHFPISLGGQVHGHIYFARLRPMLQRVYRALPPRLLRIFNQVLRR